MSGGCRVGFWIRRLFAKHYYFSVLFLICESLPDRQNIADGAEGGEGRRRKKTRFEPQRGAEAIMIDCVVDDTGNDDVDDNDDVKAGADAHSSALNERSMVEVMGHELLLLLLLPPLLLLLLQMKSCVSTT